MPLDTAPSWSAGASPDYVVEFMRRQKIVQAIIDDPQYAVGAREYYRTRPVEFINDLVFTYDPRNAGTDKPARMPFVLFPRQVDLIEFFEACRHGEASGLVEKCRDMGATWAACAYSVWLWLYVPSVSVGWGSRKEMLVDRIGDADSIFEKMRMILRAIPRPLLPPGFDVDTHATHLKILNPKTGATITGEAGDNIGRGGRKLIYFCDEAAFYERPEKIEAALGDNTRVRIDISSVNGPATVFQRRRDAGEDWSPGRAAVRGRANVFVFDWREHPHKTRAWYAEREARARAEGLLHVFRSEVDRDPTSAVENVVIPGDWVRSAVGAHTKLRFTDDGLWRAGLDVGDGGRDRNALAIGKGVVIKSVSAWAERDTGVTARRTVAAVAPLAPIEVQYDCIGVGSGVKSEINRLRDEGGLPRRVTFAAWNAGAGPNDPDKRVVEDDPESPLNRDFYANLKAQGWWLLRRRFEKTHRAITEGVKYPPDELISIEPDVENLAELVKELSQPTRGYTGKMKMMIEKTPDGARSPNYADAVMQMFTPVATNGYTLDNL